MLKRLNVFSQIDAYTTEKGGEMDDGDPNDDSVVYIFLVPNITIKISFKKEFNFKLLFFCY